MAEQPDPLEEPVARLLAASNAATAADAARTFNNPMVDAFSVAAAAAGRQVRAPDPQVERSLPPGQAVAAASGLMVSESNLAGRWWTPLVGPMVAGPSESPVAVVPERGGAVAIPAGTRAGVRVSARSGVQPPALTITEDLPQSTSWLRLLRWSVRGQRNSLLGLCLLAVVGGLTALLLPIATAALFSYAIPWGDAGKALVVLAVFAIASIGGAVLLLARNLAVIRVRDISDARLSPGLMSRVLRLPSRFFRTMPRGEILNRTLSVEQARALVDDSVPMLILASAFGIANLAFLVALNPAVGVTISLVVAVLMALTVIVQMRARSSLKKVLETRSVSDAAVMEFVAAIVPIRVAGAENRAFARWATLQAEWLSALAERMSRLNWTQPLAVLGPLAVNVVLVAVELALATPTAPRQFLPAYAAIVQLTVAMTLVSANIIRLWELGPSLSRITPLTEVPLERTRLGRAPGELAGGLTLTDVVFGYDEEQPPLLDGVTLSIQPGEFVAIVGPSGSGKTTLLRLILGFEEPWSGVVAYDGNDLADLDVAAVRRQLGTVTQSSTPFGRTFRECICGPLDITDEVLWRALENAGLDETVRQLDGGLDAEVGERGASLSGGQQQRLMIARALVGEPRMVLLDEATSALDNVTQEIVMSAVMAMPVTRIAIAHRLSTIRRADRVLVVDGGRIVEEGSPSQLQASGGHFARLAARQEF